MFSPYDFEELKQKALSDNATFEDKENLAFWLDNFSLENWNGEEYDLDGKHRMRPIYEYDKANDEYEIIDYEIL